MIPGRALHRFAASICSAKTLERIVEPAIADLQKEYTQSESGITRLFALVKGYFAIVRVIGVCAFDVSETTDDDRRAVMRTFVWWLALTCAAIALLSLPWLWNYPIALKHPHLAMTLLPQAVPLAIPIGLAFGTALGLRRRASLNAGKMILVLAAIASLLSFGLLEWALPASNQTFRDFVFQTVGAQRYAGPMNGPQKGANEMRLAELGREIQVAAASGEDRRARRYTWAFYSRFALAAATFVLALFFLTLPVEHPLGRALFAVAACFCYWMMMYLGEVATTSSYLAPFVAAWLPNIAVVVAAMVVLAMPPRYHGSRPVAAP